MAILGLVTKREMEQALKAAAEMRVKEQALLATAEAAKWEMPDPSLFKNQAELLRQSPPVSIAVNHKANVVSDAKFSVKRMVGEEEEDVPNHPFEKVFNNPNPLDSKKELMIASSSSYDVTGNCYWWMNKASEKAPPDEIWFVDAHMIVPVPDERLFLSHYNYIVNGVEMRMETWEIVHFRRYNPFNRFIGLSLIESLAVMILGDIEATKWNTRLFGENNARLPGILAFKDNIQDPDWLKIKADIKAATEKREQMLLRGVGDGVNWMQASATHREMEFLEGLGYSKSLVWDAIAPGLHSMITPSATEASGKTGETVFRNYGIYPQHQMFASKINQKILPLYGDKLKGEFDDVRITDRALELQERQAFERTHTVDETRMQYDGDAPIGDERGELFPVQITAAKAEPEQEEEDKQDPKENPQTDNAQDVAEEEDDMPMKAYIPDLIKWKRKALQRGAGKAVDYESETIPADVHDDILSALPACKSNNDIRLLFGKHMQQKQDAPTDLLAIKTMLETAINAMKGQTV